MAHSREALAKKNAMGQFNENHWSKNAGNVEVAGGKYSTGETDCPEHAKKAVDGLAGYVKKNKMQYP